MPLKCLRDSRIGIKDGHTSCPGCGPEISEKLVVCQWPVGTAANKEGIPWQERAVPHTTECHLLAATLCPEWTRQGLRKKMASFFRIIECNCLSKLVGCPFSYFIAAVSSVLRVMIMLYNARKSTELAVKFVLLTVTFTVIQEVFVLPHISTLFTIKLLLCYAELHISTFSFFCIYTILCGEQCQQQCRYRIQE